MEQRVIKIFPYSYSSLTGFETCALKHYKERLTKEFAREYNKAADDGDTWHKQAENYALHGTVIPDTNPYGKEMMRIVDDNRGKGVFQPELELAVRQDRTPCGWWDKDAYTRGKLDISVIGDSEATIIDWKTGKPDVFSTQLKHNALLLMLHHPNIHTVHTRYEWLKEGFPTVGKVHREFLEEEWAKFEKRVAKYKKAFDTNTWPDKQSGLCKKYCGVITCEHNGKFKKPN